MLCISVNWGTKIGQESAKVIFQPNKRCMNPLFVYSLYNITKEVKYVMLICMMWTIENINRWEVNSCKGLKTFIKKHLTVVNFVKQERPLQEAKWLQVIQSTVSTGLLINIFSIRHLIPLHWYNLLCIQ